MNPGNGKGKEAASVIPPKRDHVTTMVAKKIKNAVKTAVNNHNDKGKVSPSTTNDETASLEGDS